MLSYLTRRTAAALLTLLAIVTVSFFLVRLAPGGPFSPDREASKAVMENLSKAYNLDQPVWAQFGAYMAGLAHGDFGPSFKYRDYSVGELLAQGFPVSLLLGVSATLLAAPLGMALGCAAALRRDSALDRSISLLGMAGIVLPSFVTAPMLQLLFGLIWMLLPVAGWDGGLRHMVLPVLTLALPEIAVLARLTRASMIESLASAHVRTARAKGLGARTVVLRHALPGGLLPVLAYLGPATAGIVTGSVVVETFFAIPGMGRYFVEAAFNRDYTLVLGCVIVYGALIVAANMVVDLLLAALDPRVRQGMGRG